MKWYHWLFILLAVALAVFVSGMEMRAVERDIEALKRAILALR